MMLNCSVFSFRNGEVGTVFGLTVQGHAHHSATLKSIDTNTDHMGYFDDENERDYISAWTGYIYMDNADDLISNICPLNQRLRHPITNLTVTNDIDERITNESWAYYFDVTESTDYDDGGTLTCYVFEMQDEDQNTYYDCVIYGDVDVIYAPVDSNNLFAGYIAGNSDWYTMLNTIKSINIDDCFNTSKATDMNSMFMSDESELETLDLSMFDTSNVTDMSYMFCYLPLSSLDLSNFDTSNVIHMGNMFCCCHNLNDLSLSSFNTSNVEDMQAMFTECQSLEKLDLSNFNTNSVVTFGYMFISCTSLTSLNISNFDISNSSDNESVFGDCLSSLKVYVPYGHKSEFVAINSNENLTASNFIEVIDNYAFDVDGSEVTLAKYVGSAKKVVVPSSLNVGGNKTVAQIADECFKGSSKLERVDIPASVTALGDYAFADCPRLSKIYVYSTGLDIGTYAFFYNTDTSQLDNFSSAKIYVPQEMVDIYKNASDWSTYRSIIQPMSAFPNTGVKVGIIVPSIAIGVMAVAICVVAFGGKKRKIIVK